MNTFTFLKNLNLDIFYPNAGSLPAIIFIHGGGWEAGSRKDGKILKPLLKSGKFVGVSIDYTSSNHAAFPAQFNDCLTALLWLQVNAETYHIDPDKIGVWGISSGGHLASLLGVYGYVQCVVNYCGPSDLTKFKDRRVQRLLRGIRPEGASPAANIVANTPFLHIHCKNDRIVPVKQSIDFHNILQSKNIQSELMQIDSARHVVLSPKVYDKMDEFFSRWLLD